MNWVTILLTIRSPIAQIVKDSGHQHAIFQDDGAGSRIVDEIEVTVEIGILDCRMRQRKVQGRGDAERFVALGADPARVQVTGSIKFDSHLPTSLHEEAQVLRRLWGSDRPVWVAASTHEGEDEPLLDAHQRVLEQLPVALLVLVPRHPERFARVGASVEKRGLSLVTRSGGRPCGPDTQVFLGDSMGELPTFLAAADAAFVGGSLVEHGGHNLLEPAALGIPVAFGPHMFNFAEISRLLVQQGAAQFRRWFGRGAPTALMAAVVDAALAWRSP